MSELEQLAEMILDGVHKSKVQGVADILYEHSPMDIAYIAAILLQGGHQGYKPATSVFLSLGNELLKGKERDFKDSDSKNQFLVQLGYGAIKILFDKRKLRLRDDGDVDSTKFIEVCKGSKDFFENLFKFVNENPRDWEIFCRPTFKKPKPYEGFEHPVAHRLVKKANPDAVGWFTPENCPEVFKTVNTHMSNGYIINREVLNVYDAIKDNDELFLMEEKKLSVQQREGINRERNGTLQIARGLLGRRFYQFMSFDFRGRLYSDAVYLSTQGSKLSKSLIQFAEKKRIGMKGWYFMLIHAANCFGEDKLQISERVRFAKDNLDEWMVWAADPINERGWTEADEPFGFLAIIMEIYKAINEDNTYDYKSGIMIALDATCSGLQVLSLLGRDATSGKLCNLTESNVRGDFYKTIKEAVWKKFPKKVTKKQLKKLDKLVEELAPYQDKVDSIIDKIRNEDDKQKKWFMNLLLEQAINKRRWFYKENEERFEELAPVFWTLERVEQNGRSICKRPCMTFFYSCMEWTMAKTLFKDWAPEKDLRGLNPVFCSFLANRIYSTCVEEMDIPTKIMNLFIEMGMTEFSKSYEYKLDGIPMSKATAIKRLETNAEGFKEELEKGDRLTINDEYVKGGKDLCLIGPYNQFKFMQYYRKNNKVRVTITYRKSKVKLNLIKGQSADINYKKVMSATSPNVVHMLDAQIVSSIVNETDYDVSCIHDSFSVRPCDASKLFVDSRKCVHDIFKNDVLADLMSQINFDKFTKEHSYYFEYGDLETSNIDPRKNQYFIS